jgi:serine carboxypeptidase-like clade 1
MMFKTFSALGLLLVGTATAKAGPAPPDSPDKVASLWQMPDLSFGLYSGMVQIEGTQKQLHYVAALSQNDWSKDPVIVWFNGGPGCSSMIGWTQEHGPYVVEDGTTQF